MVNPWFRSKNSKFFLFFFVLGEIGLKRMLSCGLEEKEAFQDNKNVNFFKVRKMGIFQRMLTDGFGLKFEIYSQFVFL